MPPEKTPAEVVEEAVKALELDPNKKHLLVLSKDQVTVDDGMKLRKILDKHMPTTAVLFVPGDVRAAVATIPLDEVAK